MPFWSTETLKKRINELVYYADNRTVKHCACELSVGPEACITSDKSEDDIEKSKITLAEGGSFTIPPGQFALLLTEESIHVPSNAIGFISIRAGIKFQGLVNVSGFHVDPGFTGRLKFSVYNAGSRSIILTRGDRIFMLWYASLDHAASDPYEPRPGQDRVTSEDQTRMQGRVASPAALKQELDKLEREYERKISAIDHTVTTWRTLTIGLLIGMALLFAREMFEKREKTLGGTTPPPPGVLSTSQSQTNTISTEKSSIPDMAQNSVTKMTMLPDSSARATPQKSLQIPVTSPKKN